MHQPSIVQFRCSWSYVRLYDPRQQGLPVMANSGDENGEIVVLQMLDAYADRVFGTFA